MTYSVQLCFAQPALLSRALLNFVRFRCALQRFELLGLALLSYALLSCALLGLALLNNVLLSFALLSLAVVLFALLSSALLQRLMEPGSPPEDPREPGLETDNHRQRDKE